jgi:hypothetical protein
VNFDQPDECYEYGALALKLAEKIPHAPSISRTETNVAAFAQWYREPMHNCKKTLLGAFKHSVENSGILKAIIGEEELYLLFLCHNILFCL